MNLKIKKDIWFYIGLLILVLYLLFLLYPIYNLLIKAFYNQTTKSFTSTNFEKFFSKSYYFKTLLNSFKVTIAVTVLTICIGTPIAYFMSTVKIKGKKYLQIIIILASMSAPFIGAYSWILLLGRSGVLTSFLKSIGINIGDIYGFKGILLVMTLQLYPLVFLYIQGTLRNVDRSLLEASQSMGTKPLKQFFMIVLPLIKPTILAASILVFMRSFADFGTAMLIGEGYKTFPVLLYNSFISELGQDEGFAAAISIIAIVITTSVFLVQKYIANRNQFSMSALNSLEAKEMKGVKNIIVHIFIYGFVALSILPQCYVALTSFYKTKGLVFVKGFSLDSYYQAFSQLRISIFNTIFIPGVALVLIIILSVLISYIVVRRRNRLSNTVDIISMIPYIIPGSVLGIALLSAFNKKPILLAGSYTIMIIALVIRRLPYTIRSSSATLQQVSISLEEASISLGSSKLRTFFKITIPTMTNGILAGAILSWITMITELSTGIILYTARTQTMTISIYIQVIRGKQGVAAAMSSILMLMTIIALLIFNKLSKNKDITI